MSINALLDRVDFKCTICGTSMKVGCDCWITLRCPCGRTQSTERQKGDPSGKYLDTTCPLHPKCMPSGQTGVPTGDKKPTTKGRSR